MLVSWTLELAKNWNNSEGIPLKMKSRHFPQKQPKNKMLPWFNNNNKEEVKQISTFLGIFFLLASVFSRDLLLQLATKITAVTRATQISRRADSLTSAYIYNYK